MSDIQIVYVRKAPFSLASSELPRPPDNLNKYPEEYRQYVPESLWKYYFPNTVKKESE